MRLIMVCFPILLPADHHQQIGQAISLVRPRVPDPLSVVYHFVSQITRSKPTSRQACGHLNFMGSNSDLSPILKFEGQLSILAHIHAVDDLKPEPLIEVLQRLVHLPQPEHEGSNGVCLCHTLGPALFQLLYPILAISSIVIAQISSDRYFLNLIKWIGIEKHGDNSKKNGLSNSPSP